MGTVFIAGFAFWLSFTALTHLARRAGIAEGQAWAWPLIVDGMIVVATVAVVALRDRKGHGYAWLLLGCGAGVSVTANAVQAAMPPGVPLPAGLAAAVSSVPPLVLLASTHLTVVLARREDADRTGQADTPGQDSTATDNGPAAVGSPSADTLARDGGAPPAGGDGVVVPAGIAGPAGDVPMPAPPPAPSAPTADAAESGSAEGLDGAGLRRLLLGLDDDPPGGAAGGETPRTFGVEEAKRLKAAGLSNRAIGARLGVDPTTVGRWLRSSEGDNQ